MEEADVANASHRATGVCCAAQRLLALCKTYVVSDIRVNIRFFTEFVGRGDDMLFKDLTVVHAEPRTEKERIWRLTKLAFPDITRAEFDRVHKHI